MPKVRPLTEAQKEAARRKAAVINFQLQMERLGKEIGMTARQAIGLATGAPRPSTTSIYYKDPWRMTKAQERGILLLFEQSGLVYDPSWGEGAEA